MRRYYYNPLNSFRYSLSIDYLSHDRDQVNSVEFAGNSIEFDYLDGFLYVKCDDEFFDCLLEDIVNFRFIDRFNTQLADYL